MADFKKYAYEEIWRYFNFDRGDDYDGLAVGETLSSVTVTCEDSTGTDVTSTMISGAAVSSAALAVYMIKGGTAGETYTVIIRGVTSESQKLEGRATVAIWNA
jgi:hypothetical protein